MCQSCWTHEQSMSVHFSFTKCSSSLSDTSAESKGIIRVHLCACLTELANSPRECTLLSQYVVAAYCILHQKARAYVYMRKMSFGTHEQSLSIHFAFVICHINLLHTSPESKIICTYVCKMSFWAHEQSLSVYFAFVTCRSNLSHTSPEGKKVQVSVYLATQYVHMQSGCYLANQQDLSW